MPSSCFSFFMSTISGKNNRRKKNRKKTKKQRYLPKSSSEMRADRFCNVTCPVQSGLLILLLISVFDNPPCISIALSVHSGSRNTLLVREEWGLSTAVLFPAKSVQESTLGDNRTFSRSKANKIKPLSSEFYSHLCH